MEPEPLIGGLSMYKVMIIDDEPTIREGLKQVVDWEAYGFSIVDTATDGRNGLHKIRTYNPDLVFADIRMPGLSGIEMIQQAKTEGYSAKCIILSGYSSFSYAQQSIKLGIESYLLKPIDEQELISLLIQIKDTLDREKRIGFQLNRYQVLSEEQTLMAILEGKITNLTMVPEHIIQHTTFQLVSLENGGGTEQLDWATMLKELNYPNLKVLSRSTNWLLLFMDHEEPETIRISQQLLSKLRLQGDISSVLFVAEVCRTFDQLTMARKQIDQLRQIAFCYGGRSILTYKLLAEQTLVELELEDLKQPIIQALEFHDSALLETQWEKMKAHFQSRKIAKGVIQAELVEFLIQLYRAIKQAYPELSTIKKNEIIKMVYQATTIQEILTQLQVNLWELATQMDGFIINSENNMEKITNYIHQYYYQDINLKVLAQLFNYNSSYLGKKFKKHTGNYFHTYLDQVRIKQAKQLLQDRVHKVYEISELVGYNNMDYFYKKFKKYVGMSPKEYQKKTTVKRNLLVQ